MTNGFGFSIPSGNSSLLPLHNTYSLHKKPSISLCCMAGEIDGFSWFGDAERKGHTVAMGHLCFCKKTYML